MIQINELIVAAIDLGTTYSNYAYSVRDEYKQDPLKIYSCSAWTGGAVGTQKTPTVILFDESGEFHSFGTEAEAHYMRLAKNGEHAGWRYFQRFKLALEKGKVNKNIEIKDEQGRSMSAMKVFSASIRYLREHAMTPLRQKVPGFDEDTDVRWVLTIPAVWDKAAKQFMIAAAKEAGIREERLVLAYEPAAAAMYCKEQDEKSKDKTNVEGLKFIIVDLGGGTIDMMAFKVTKQGTLLSITTPSGGPWGGILVDNHFLEYMKKIFDKKVFETWERDSKNDRLELDQLFEKKKKTIQEGSQSVRLKVPYTIYDTFQQVRKVAFEEAIEKGEFKGKVKKLRDMLDINSSLYVDMFKESAEKTIAHVKKELKRTHLKDVRTMVLVGGFSDSYVIQQEFRDKFPGHDIVNPKDAENAIVIGAVIYGYRFSSTDPDELPFDDQGSGASGVCTIL